VDETQPLNPKASVPAGSTESISEDCEADYILHEPHTSLHLDTYKAAPANFFTLPIENMLQLSSPSECLASLQKLWKATSIIATLMGAWTFGEIGNDYSKLKCHTATLDMACTICVVLAFCGFVVSTLMLVGFLSESALWIRAVDQRWYLLEYKNHFKVPQILFIMGFTSMCISIIILVYMKLGKETGIIVGIIVVVADVFITYWYNTMVMHGYGRMKNSVRSLNTALAVFNQLDINKNGEVTMDEWDAAVEELQHQIHVPKERLQMAFHRIATHHKHLTWHDFISNFAPMATVAKVVKDE